MRDQVEKAVAQGLMAEITAMRFAQLDDMPFEIIEAWLLVRGLVVVGRDWHRRAVERHLYEGHRSIDAREAL